MQFSKVICVNSNFKWIFLNNLIVGLFFFFSPLPFLYFTPISYIRRLSWNHLVSTELHDFILGLISCEVIKFVTKSKNYLFSFCRLNSSVFRCFALVASSIACHLIFGLYLVKLTKHRPTAVVKRKVLCVFYFLLINIVLICNSIHNNTNFITVISYNIRATPLCFDQPKHGGPMFNCLQLSDVFDLSIVSNSLTRPQFGRRSAASVCVERDR